MKSIAKHAPWLVLAFAGLIAGPAVAASLQAQAWPVPYHTELAPPPYPGFRETMGGWPKEITQRTLRAARGSLTISAYANDRTELTFDLHGLLPFGVYTLWDVVNPDLAHFKDRPLANIPEDAAFDAKGGPEGFGSYGFMADQNGRAYVVVNLDHRPARAFLLDYHADGHVRGGQKGETVFPGILWAQFPDWP